MQLRAASTPAAVKNTDALRLWRRASRRCASKVVPPDRQRGAARLRPGTFRPASITSSAAAAPPSRPSRCSQRSRGPAGTTPGRRPTASRVSLRTLRLRPGAPLPPPLPIPAGPRRLETWEARRGSSGRATQAPGIGSCSFCRPSLSPQTVSRVPPSDLKGRVGLRPALPRPEYLPGASVVEVRLGNLKSVLSKAMVGG